MALIIAYNAAFVASLLVLTLSFHTSFGHGVTCENLNEDTCAFAVSSTGKRCVLERSVKIRSGMEAYTCRASEIEADRVTNVIESDRCVKACGLERKTLGISSDALLEPRFTRKLCSAQCFNHCSNVVDLYFNLAAGEGVYLPKLCEAQEENKRRGMMSEIRSSGVAFNSPSPVGLLSLADIASEPSVSPSASPF